MKIANPSQLLSALIRSTTPKEVREILEACGDRPDIGLDEPFGSLGLFWHAFDDNTSNFSTIGLGTKPGRSLTERLTNAMDAILDERVVAGVDPPRSSREAAQKWFGRPVTGPDEGMFQWDFAGGGYDRRIAVVLVSSGIESRPTVDVLDDGIGITPEDFPGTIVSLHEGNKIKKFHLIGAFGQGGASTIAFSEYVIIVSRQKDRRNVAGLTIVRVLNLSEDYKEDTFAYLAMRNTDGKLVVPSVDVGNGPLTFYQPQTGMRLPDLSKGTLVRHVSYVLSNIDRNLGPSPGNLYHFLHASLFDPLFPFRLIDLRDLKKSRDELVSGSRNRLMKLVKKAGPADDDSGGSEIRHYRPMEYVVPLGSSSPAVGVEYWVVLNYRKSKGVKGEELILRPQSNELYVDTGHPVLGTLNGQNQGELTGLILRDLGLGMIAKHIVIHIDATNSDRRVRRELFATSREGFKDGPVLEDLKRVLTNMLKEDEALYALERELTERLVKRESETTSEEVRRQVTRLLLDAGFRVKEEGPSVKAGEKEGEKQPVSPLQPGMPHKPLPLATLPFPEVTKLNIVTPRPKMNVRVNDNKVILVETDADAEFDRRGLIAIRTEPDRLELAAKVPLRGGRIRWRLRPRQEAAPGDLGKIIVTLTKLDGTQLMDSIDFEVLSALEEAAKKAKGIVPPFRLIAINPTDNQQQWDSVWPECGIDEEPAKQASVAYKPIRAGDEIVVYYSTIFEPFRDQLEKLKTQSGPMLDLFKTNYEVWIAYHAILQEGARPAETEGIDEAAADRLLEADRMRVARMQVKQAMQAAELMSRTIQAQQMG